MKKRNKNFTSQYLFKHIQDNIFQYFSLMIIFIISIIIGVIIFNTSDDEQKNKNMQIIDTYISSNLSENIDKGYILKESIQRNLIFIVIISLLTFTFIGGMSNYISIGLLGFRTSIYNVNNNYGKTNYTAEVFLQFYHYCHII